MFEGFDGELLIVCSSVALVALQLEILLDGVAFSDLGEARLDAHLAVAGDKAGARDREVAAGEVHESMTVQPCRTCNNDHVKGLGTHARTGTVGVRICLLLFDGS